MGMLNVWNDYMLCKDTHILDNMMLMLLLYIHLMLLTNIITLVEALALACNVFLFDFMGHLFLLIRPQWICNSSVLSPNVECTLEITVHNCCGPCTIQKCPIQRPAVRKTQLYSLACFVFLTILDDRRFGVWVECLITVLGASGTSFHVRCVWAGLLVYQKPFTYTSMARDVPNMM